MRFNIAFAICFGAALPSAAFGQGSDLYSYPTTYKDFNALVQNPRQLTFSRLPGITADYRIGPGDQLAIAVQNLSALSLTLDVSNSGKINMPLLGSLAVAEMTTTELEEKIAGLLKDRQLVNNPEVLVDVVEFAGKPIYILGQVDRAGEYMMSQQWTLMDAILIAGGLDVAADRYGYLHRRLLQGGEDDPVATTVVGDGRNRVRLNLLKRSMLPSVDKPNVALPGSEIIRVDLTPLKRGGVLESNILLRTGDVFIIPKRNPEVFYVIGDVRRAGAIDIDASEPSQKIMVSQAIAWAGGPTSTARTSEGILVRYDSAGKRIQQAVDFAAVLRGRQPDFEVFPDDIIFIPGSRVKTLSYGLLGVIPQAVESSVPAVSIKPTGRKEQ